MSDSFWARWIKSSVAVGLVALAIFVLVILIGLMRGDVHWPRDTGVELQEYVDGFMSSDFDRLEPHLCDRVRDEIAALPGGFDEARSETLASLPAPLEDVVGLSSASRYGRTSLVLANNDDVVRYLFIMWVDDQPRFCPPSATRLLGSAQRPG